MFYIINDANGNLIDITGKLIRAYNYVNRNPLLNVRVMSSGGSLVASYPYGTDFIIDVLEMEKVFGSSPSNDNTFFFFSTLSLD